jgi:hypothetical protein
MKIRTIIFGSIFACLLIILVPNISAIEFIIITKNTVDYNENELIAAIKEKIEQLKAQKTNLQISLIKDDPDGPFEGGLDDTYDWVDLYFGIIYGYILLLFIKNKSLKNAFSTGNIFTIIIWLIDYGLYSIDTLRRFGDAFDIIDPDENGY